MDILIYGAGESGKKLLRSLKKYKDIHVVGFIDILKKEKLEEIPIINLEKAKDYYNTCPIVISVANFYDRRRIYEDLKSKGFQKIYIYLRKDFCKEKDFFKCECIELDSISENVLFYAEMGIIDFCNLNCKGCNHYSPIFEKKYPDFDKRMEDVKKIASLYNDILEFGLIGGEPLLSPDIEQYIISTRKLLPKTEIQIVTNGLLIPKLEQKILKCISENNITISISQYFPTVKIINSIRKQLEQFSIDYVLKPVASKEKFYKTLCLNKDNIYEKKCISQGCINICDGRIAKCPSVLYIEELNKKFCTHFPNDGIYNLEDFWNGQELNLKLERKIPLCEYCISYQIDWEMCSREKN